MVLYVPETLGLYDCERLSTPGEACGVFQRDLDLASSIWSPPVHAHDPAPHQVRNGLSCVPDSMDPKRQPPIIPMTVSLLINNVNVQWDTRNIRKNVMTLPLEPHPLYLFIAHGCYPWLHLCAAVTLNLRSSHIRPTVDSV